MYIKDNIMEIIEEEKCGACSQPIPDDVKLKRVKDHVSGGIGLSKGERGHGMISLHYGILSDGKINLISYLNTGVSLNIKRRHYELELIGHIIKNGTIRFLLQNNMWSMRFVVDYVRHITHHSVFYYTLEEKKATKEHTESFIYFNEQIHHEVHKPDHSLETYEDHFPRVKSLDHLYCKLDVWEQVYNSGKE